MVVVLVEVMRKGYLAAIVPVIVNAILSEHQLVVDIVAFVSKGDFPRSRLGEKQRGKILATWVTRKMRTIAQFGIRDADGADSQITEVAEPSSRMGSTHNGSIVASSLRHAETPGDSYPQDQIPPPDISEQQQYQQQTYAPLPSGISEMPAYDESPIEARPGDISFSNRTPMVDDDDTPTDVASARPYHFELPGIAPYDGSTPPPVRQDSRPTGSEQDFYQSGPYHLPTTGGTASLTPPPPAVPPKPTRADKYDDEPPYLAPLQTESLGGTLASNPRNNRQSTYLPSVSGHETLDQVEASDPRSPPSQPEKKPPSSGLRIANADPPSDDDAPPAAAAAAELSDWPQEAIMHMNLSSAADAPRPTSKKDSRGAKLGMHVYGQPLKEIPAGTEQEKKQTKEKEGWAPGDSRSGTGGNSANTGGGGYGGDYSGYGYGHAM